jgi:hypothetical protein
MDGSNERAVLVGGCLWGMQDLLGRFPVVISTRVGYAGGKLLTRLTVITKAKLKRSKLSSILSNSSIAVCWSSSSRYPHPHPTEQHVRGDRADRCFREPNQDVLGICLDRGEHVAMKPVFGLQNGEFASSMPLGR